jgi:predicted Zn-dependent peptidase
VRAGKKPEDVELEIYTQIEMLKQQPVAAWELAKAKNTTRFGYLQSIRSAQSRAIMLGSYTVKYNDPNLINTRLDRIDAVTPEDLQRVARQYLQAANRTVMITVPAAKTAGL